MLVQVLTISIDFRTDNTFGFYIRFWIGMKSMFLNMTFHFLISQKTFNALRTIKHFMFMYFIILDFLKNKKINFKYINAYVLLEDCHNKLKFTLNFPRSNVQPYRPGN